jgi:hypothetical protein
MGASFSARASTYYVATNGMDSNNGLSTTAPFATFSKAISTAQAGDTIYARGGQYNLSATLSISSSKVGSAANPYNLFAYPGESPVLNFSAEPTGARGIQLDGNYWNIRGLMIQNAKDNGINITGSNNTLDRLLVHNNQDSGVQISGTSSRAPANNLVLNTDSYANYDPAAHGENADGFAAKFRELGPGNVFRGDRAWGNADDGWDFWAAANGVVVENCWSFKNGFNNFGYTNFQGDGNGLKLGHDSGPHTLRDLVVWGNRLNGIDVNGNATVDTTVSTPYVPIAHGVTIENVTAYNNGNTSGSQNFNFDENYPHSLRNNISLTGSVNIFAQVVNDHDTWNSGFTVGTGDFLSLIDTVASGPRQADGSLPISDFLHLAPGSELIDEGVNVGLPFNGSAPDLGAFETPEPATLLPASIIFFASLRIRRRV